jgi:hypothetical protein
MSGFVHASQHLAILCDWLVDFHLPRQATKVRVQQDTAASVYQMAVTVISVPQNCRNTVELEHNHTFTPHEAWVALRPGFTSTGITESMHVCLYSQPFSLFKG